MSEWERNWIRVGVSAGGSLPYLAFWGSASGYVASGVALWYIERARKDGTDKDSSAITTVSDSGDWII